ncbi:MAG: hypothetical protein JWQ11_3717 [Rhizobacter sp.]|nr:hypothetical protein [Rhizobacter sp.]
MSKSMPTLALIAAGAILSALPTWSSAEALGDVKATCQFVGNGAGEPIGDREGHGLQIHDYSCVNQGGPEDGAVMTGSSVAEYDSTGSVMLVGSGMLRKPGGLAVYELSEQQTRLVMRDGKVAGFAGASKGQYKLGTGSLAAISGKNYTSTFHSISASQFVIDIKFE